MNKEKERLRKGDRGTYHDGQEKTRIRVTRDQPKGGNWVEVTPEAAPNDDIAKSVPVKHINPDD